MKTVHVSICTGTTCFLMGGAHLLSFNEMLDADTMQLVRISGSHCLGLCNDEANGKAPFVKVNDCVISDATLKKMLNQVHKELKRED